MFCILVRPKQQHPLEEEEEEEEEEEAEAETGQSKKTQKATETKKSRKLTRMVSQKTVAWKRRRLWGIKVMGQKGLLRL